MKKILSLTANPSLKTLFSKSFWQEENKIGNQNFRTLFKSMYGSDYVKNKRAGEEFSIEEKYKLLEKLNIMFGVRPEVIIKEVKDDVGPSGFDLSIQTWTKNLISWAGSLIESAKSLEQ